MSTRSILVTGATGFLGGAVTRRLLRERASVIATGRDIEALAGLANAGAQALACDLTGGWPGRVPDLEAVVHCAALSSAWGRKSDFEAANIDATRTAIALARAAGARRFVHISTPSLYFRFADQDGLGEDTALPPPVNHYARTKRVSEALVLDAADLDPVILRPRAIYGRGDKALLPRMIAAARRGPLPFMRGGRAATDLTHVDDVVDAVLSALAVPASPSHRVFNISGGAALQLTGVIAQACQKSGIVPQWRPVPFRAVEAVARAAELAARIRPGRPEPLITAYAAGILAFRQTLDIRRARTILGWRPLVSFEEGVARTFGPGGRDQ